MPHHQETAWLICFMAASCHVALPLLLRSDISFHRTSNLLGWMIAEAMAHGKPVATTRVDGIPELIEDHESGYLVDRGDTKTMSNKILTLLNDALLREHMGSKGKNIARQKFNLRNNVTKLIASYRLEECRSVAGSIPVRRLQEGLW